MDAYRYLEFDSDFFNKCTTPDHYINKGAFGEVYGPIPWRDKQVAIKQVMLAQGKATDDFKKDMEAKQQLWSSLGHENILRIHSVDLTRLPKAMFIVMEYAAGGSVTDTLRSLGHRNKLPIDIVTYWAKQIADGMLYLHDEKNIVHRDLKSSNILLMEPYNACNTDATVTLKIADFDDIKEHDHTVTMSFVGTCAYMAPEVITYQRFSKASDVWSFGVVIWEMLSGDIPYKDIDSSTILKKVSRGEPKKLIIESFPKEYKLLLNGCWKSISKERPPIHEILSAIQHIGSNQPQAAAYSVPEQVASPTIICEEGNERLPEIYKSNPVLIKTIQTKVGQKEKIMIRGLTILYKELFVVTASSSEIEVYDSITLDFSRQFIIAELHNPSDIASCPQKNCLYIVDFIYSRRSKGILRVDSSGKIITAWLTGDELECVLSADQYGKLIKKSPTGEGNGGISLSVAYESNIILTLQQEKQLIEYTPDGELIRNINLSDVGIHYAWHAIKLTNGNFIVSHGLHDDDLHRVCLVDTDGKLMKSFGGKCGWSIKQIFWPVYLSVNGNGFVFVAEKGNNRILLLNSNLEFERAILTEKHRLRYPQKILLDESTNRLFLAEYGLSFVGLIKIFQL